MRAHHHGRRLAALPLAALLVLGACSSSDDDDAAADDGAAGPAAGETVELPAGYEGYTSETYADDAHWLCKPGIGDDVCSQGLDATAVAADGPTGDVDHG